MEIIRFQSKVDQVVEHLRMEMQRGRWGYPPSEAAIIFIIIF